MKEKKILKKLGLWVIGITLACGVCCVLPRIISGANTSTHTAQENKGVPQITIDAQGYDLTCAPEGVVGKSYKVFDATAIDNYGNGIKVQKKLWLYYYSSTKSRVALQNDAFIPQQVGEYVMEYTAVDREGNKAVKTYTFACVERDSLTLIVQNGIKTGKAGLEIQLATPIVENTSGVCKTDVYVASKNSNDVYEVGEDFTFIPMYAGTYVVEYRCSDYVETATASYEITVENNDVPLFFEEVKIPQFFVANKMYQLQVPKAFHFALGKPVAIEPVITVEDSQNNVSVLEDGVFTPQAEGTVTIRYKIAYGENEEQIIKESKVVDVDYGLENAYEKYFYSEDCTTTLTMSAVEIFTLTNGAQVQFINPVLANKANIQFSANIKYKNYKALDVYLTDSVDKSAQIKITLQDKLNGGMTYTINDEKTYSLSSCSYFLGERMELAYLNDARVINLNQSLDITLKTTLSGEPFDGFQSGRVEVTFAFNGVEGHSGLLVYKINNQTLNANAMDSVPEIVFTKHQGGQVKLGEVVNLNRFYVGDVLDYDSIVKFYVLDPDNNFVTALDGTFLDGNGVDYISAYSIFMEKAGSYNVCMEISDSLGNTELYAYGITAVDVTPPKIVLGVGKTSYNVGENVKVCDAKATDAKGESVDVYVYVYNPDGTIVSIKNGHFYAQKKGVYTVYYQAMDTKGLLTIESYKITVS